MSNLVNYGEAGFLKRAIYLVKSGEELSILVNQKRHIKLLLAEINIVTKDKNDGIFPSIKLVFFMLPFLTMHFYALSGGYKVAHEGDGSGLKIIYKR